MLQRLLNHTVFKNFSYLTVSTGISQLISLITVLKVTSMLSPDDYGLFTFLIAQGMLLLRLGDLGGRNVVIRTISREPEKTNDLVLNGALLRCLALLLFTVFYVVYNYFFGTLSGIELTMVFVFSIVNCFSTLFEMVFLGNQKMKPSSIINLIFSISWFLIVFTIGNNHISASHLFALYIFNYLIKTVIFLLFLKHYKLLIGKLEDFFQSSRKLLTESWPYFAMIIIMLPLTSLSNNFLDINSTKEEIGYFNLAQRLIGPVSLLISIILTAIFPNLSSYWLKDENKLFNYITKGFRFYFLLTLFPCFVFALFSYELISIFFADAYLPAVDVCQMQIWYLFLTSIDSLIGVILGAINKEKVILMFGLGYFAICTPILYYSSNFGALGLSYGYFFSYAFCIIFIWILFKRLLKIRIKHDLLLWTFSLILFLIVYLLPTNTLILYRIMIFGLVAIVLVLYLYKSQSLAYAK